jgi:hypothetical protein
MPTSDRARQIRQQFDRLPPSPPRVKAEAKPPPTAAEQIFQGAELLPDAERGGLSPLDGRAQEPWGRK